MSVRSLVKHRSLMMTYYLLNAFFFIFQLYTVVRNVKEAHECQESGETQEFDDDIDYLLAGIRDVEPMSTRCLR